MRMRRLMLGFILTAIAFTYLGTVRAQAPAVKDTQPRVTVVITSDQQTWVSVTNVRQPAKFRSLRLQLAPGVYEIVGRRKGYRDENRTLILKDGVPTPSVSVICTVSSQDGSR